LNELEQKMNDSVIQIKMMQQRQDTLAERIISIESQSRRDNLIIEGIPEAPWGARETFNDCVNKVFEILESKLKITNAKDIRLTRCHRLGPPPPRSNQPGTPTARSRAMIFKCHWFGDRQRIWQAKRHLKGSNIVLREDFPQEILERRKKLSPIQKAAAAAGHEAWLAVDKLHIKFAYGGHSVFTVNTINKLPAQLHPHNVSTKKTENCLAFFSGLCPLSNFYNCSLKIDGDSFHSTEQFYQLCKAKAAGDEVAEAKIRQATTPLQCKQAGDRVKLGTRSTMWDQQCIGVMKKALLKKVDQNKDVKDFLMHTGTREIAEANGNDLFWGTGERSVLGNWCCAGEATDRGTWRGQNHLGSLWSEIRTTLQ
jgi:ribA/ribD-fused uncharacterized protein